VRAGDVATCAARTIVARSKEHFARCTILGTITPFFGECRSAATAA
jgi:hypothetical protein